MGTDDEEAPQSFPMEDHDGKADALAQQPSNVESIWASTTLSFPREVFFVTLICMAQLCTQAAFMGTLLVLPSVGATFNVTSPPQLAWLVAGYSLTVGTFILFSGRLGDVIGYKTMLIAGFCWFSVWSLATGFSAYASFGLAIFFRVLQGIGPAICLPNALAILGASYPPGPRKAMVFAFFGAVAPLGGVLGSTFTSLLALAWWPWAHWTLAMVLAILAAASFLIIPNLPTRSARPTTWKSWVQVLDLPAAFLGIAALVLFNFAWIQAPIDGWGTPTAIVPLVLGMILFGAFLFAEFRLSKLPLLPFEVINGDVAFVLAAVACGWATFGVWTLYLVRILEDIRHLSPLLTTAWFSPVIVSGAVAAVVTGKLLGAMNARPPVVMTVALLAFTAGIILTAFAPIDQIYWGQIFVSMIIMPFGMDMSFPAATLILSNAVPKHHQGIGASLVNTVVNYGIALGVGFAGTVEVNVYGNGLSEDEMLRGFRGALYMGIGLAGLGLTLCLAFLAKTYAVSQRK